MRVWDAKTGELLTELQGYILALEPAAFSPDGNRIVSGERVWDAKTGEQLQELQGNTGGVHSPVAFSTDGNRIVSGSWDNSVRVWDANTGELLRELQDTPKLSCRSHSRLMTTELSLVRWTNQCECGLI